MPRPTLLATKAGKHDQDIARIEDLRHNLPVNVYLEVLHIAATTGKLRDYSEDGTLIGVKAISPDQQLKTAQYLVDKAMPNKAPSRIEATPELSNAQVAESPELLTMDQLRKMAYNEPTV
jgi:hypothetical protein